MNDYEFRRHLVLRAIDSGHCSLGEVARASGGIYPAELKEMLAILEREELIRNDGQQRWFPALPKEQPPLVMRRESWTASQLLLPHPHDCDWRFSDDTARVLAEKVIGATPRPPGHHLLLGAPRLFVELCNYQHLSRVTLIDRNKALLIALEAKALPPGFVVIHHDLSIPSPSHDLPDSDVVVCDPPWYTEYYATFLAHASRAARIGATVFVSLLPISTRPGAAMDRSAILNVAANLGLHVQALEPAALAYDSPPFEQRSLRTVGIAVMADWRRADLLLLRKVHEPPERVVSAVYDFGDSIPSEVDPSGAWFEVAVRGLKIKIRAPLGEPDEMPELSSLEVNDVLPTVSRRYPGRARVDLWMWDNRVYGARGRTAIWLALNRLAGRDFPDLAQVVPAEAIARAQTIIESVLL